MKGIDISEEDVEIAKSLVNVDKSDKAYLKSGKWKCPKSLGAHFWLIEELGQRRNIRLNKQTCAYCGEVRKYCLMVE